MDADPGRLADKIRGSPSCFDRLRFRVQQPVFSSREITSRLPA